MGYTGGDPNRDLRLGRDQARTRRKKALHPLSMDSHNGDSKASDTEQQRKDDRAMATTFDPINYKKTTRDQWQTAASAWNRWGPFIDQWLGAATETMLDLANVHSGSRVLDVAAGAGGQTLATARSAGPSGFVLATDISSNIIEIAATNTPAAALTNVETPARDCNDL